ncbi:MAG: heme exporter protein CcmB, partial [Proteobacteria bacterium]|nr:heme exporter protein CcmB [Pseudomonadota bacterium]
MSFLALAGQILRKDFRIEVRSREGVNTLLFFSTLLVFLFRFAGGSSEAQVREAAPGLLGLAFILTGLWGMARTFQVERENDCLEFLRLAPGDLGGIYLGKVVVGCCLMWATELAILAMFAASTVAIFQTDVKRMLAYSSVAQIGYIVLGISFASETGLTGAIVHLFNHALTKGALFLVLG